MSSDLSGLSVVLTGATGRLGRVLAQHLLEAGAAVSGVSDHEAEGAAPERLHAYVADLADERQVADVFDRIEGDLGPPHALVHTVGMWAGAPLAETALADWETMMRVNLTTTFLCFREAVRRMRKAGQGGRLVAIASRQGAEGGVAEQAAYSASKAGVVRLVEAAAAEQAEHGITAAAVAPSTILFGSESEGARGVPVERIAALCAYLCAEGGLVHNGTVLRAYGI